MYICRHTYFNLLDALCEARLLRLHTHLQEKKETGFIHIYICFDIYFEQRRFYLLNAACEAG